MFAPVTKVKKYDGISQIYLTNGDSSSLSTSPSISRKFQIVFLSESYSEQEIENFRHLVYILKSVLPLDRPILDFSDRER